MSLEKYKQMLYRVIIKHKNTSPNLEANLNKEAELLARKLKIEEWVKNLI